MGLTAPEDYQQGMTVRILFVHVPFAWLSMMVWTVMSASALGLLVWRHPIAEVSIRAAAPIGAVFTFLCLFTGRSGGARCGARGGCGTRGSRRSSSSS